MSASDWYVIIRWVDTDEEEHTMGPMSEPKAEKCARGVLRKLDTDRFYVEVEERDAKA